MLLNEMRAGTVGVHNLQKWGCHTHDQTLRRDPTVPFRVLLLVLLLVSPVLCCTTAECNDGALSVTHAATIRVCGADDAGFSQPASPAA